MAALKIRILAQLPEGDGGLLADGVPLLPPQDGKAGIDLVAAAGEGGEHLESLQLIRGLAQHRPVQGHHRIGGDHHRIHARLLPHGPGLLRRDAAHQLLRGQLPLHVLVNIGGDDAKVLYPHALQKLPPPGRLGGQNDLHTSVPFLIGRRGAAAAALRPVP